MRIYISCANTESIFIENHMGGVALNEIYPLYFISKTFKLNYLLIQMSIGNHLASWASTYHCIMSV